MVHLGFAPFRSARQDVPSSRQSEVVLTSAQRFGVRAVVSDGERGRRFSGRNIISYILFAAAAALFVVVAVLYYQDRHKEEPKTPPPASNPGHADLKNVVDALKAQGIKVDYARSGGVRSDDLTPPGQGLTADGKPLYVFIYEDTDSRTTETTDLGTDLT